MDSSFWIALAQQSPGVAGVLVVVIIFIRHLDRRDETMKSIGDGCHEAQRKTVDAINDNTLIMGQVKEGLRRLNGR